jgi:hypothetical protein
MSQDIPWNFSGWSDQGEFQLRVLGRFLWRLEGVAARNIREFRLPRHKGGKGGMPENRCEMTGSLSAKMRSFICCPR